MKKNIDHYTQIALLVTDGLISSTSANNPKFDLIYTYKNFEKEKLN